MNNFEAQRNIYEVTRIYRHSPIAQATEVVRRNFAKEMNGNPFEVVIKTPNPNQMYELLALMANYFHGCYNQRTGQEINLGKISPEDIRLSIAGQQMLFEQFSKHLDTDKLKQILGLYPYLAQDEWEYLKEIRKLFESWGLPKLEYLDSFSA